jgi:lipoprotein-anchoring transpeptidase ErfK/SrfK
MKAMKTDGRQLAMAAMTAMVLASQANAQDAVKRVIVVSLEDHKLALVEDGQVKKVYTVAVGKPSTPSPVGTFTIERRVANPTYQHNGKIVPPGPRNPVGTRWMGLSKHGYGIHGTNEPNSIGKAASHGCIRMAKADLEELYPLVAEGDTVELIGQRNEETAQLFGNSESPAAAAEPILLATALTQAPAQEKDSSGRQHSQSESPGRG